MAHLAKSALRLQTSPQAFTRTGPLWPDFFPANKQAKEFGSTATCLTPRLVSRTRLIFVAKLGCMRYRLLVLQILLPTFL